MTKLRWEHVPTEFHYLRDAIEACGETQILHYDAQAGRHVPFIETASDAQLALIRSARDQVQRRDDLSRIARWCEDPVHKRPSIRTAIWYIQGMLSLFDRLAPQSPEEHQVRLSNGTASFLSDS